jgi:hypothetical protein
MNEASRNKCLWKKRKEKPSPYSFERATIKLSGERNKIGQSTVLFFPF